MANFSTLFPNLQDNLDFAQADGSVFSGTGAGSSNKVIHWAQSDDTSIIPLSKLPNFDLSNTHTFSDTTSTGTATTNRTEAQALAAFIAAYEDQANIADFENINAGDIVIIQYIPDGADSTTTAVAEYIYASGTPGQPGTAGTAVVPASFSAVQQAAATAVNTLQASSTSNLLLNVDGSADSTTALSGMLQIDLDPTLAGITSINATGAGALSLSQSGSTTAIVGDATVAGTLGVTGATTLASASATSISSSGAVTFSNLVDGDAAAKADHVLTINPIGGSVGYKDLGDFALSSELTGGTLTGIDAGSNIVVNDGATTTPEVALATNVDIAGTLDVTGNATFDSNVTLGKFGATEAAATLVGFSANATNFNVNANASSTLAAPSWNINSQSYDGNTAGSNLSIGASNFSLNSATAGSGTIGAGTAGLSISTTSSAVSALSISASNGGVDIDAGSGAQIHSGTAGIEINHDGSITATSGSANNISLVASGTGRILVSGTGLTGTGSTAAAAAPIGITSTGQLVTGVNVGGGAMDTDGTTETATTTGETADANAVYFIPRKTITAYTLNLPAAGAAGSWIKIVNNSNLSSSNTFDDTPVTAVTIGTGTGQIAGNGADASMLLDDPTANLELISDGTRWNIISA